MVQRSLVIVHSPGLQALSDFETVQRLIAERARDIEAFIANNRLRQSLTRKKAATLPSITFSPSPLREFAPARGKIFAGKTMPKSEEIARLVAGGVPVPRTVVVEPEMRLDPDEWGPLVVLKPEYGMRGEAVRLARTTDVAWVDPMSWPQGDIRRGHRMLAQQYVPAGRHPVSYRVMTVFGRPVYSTSTRAVDAMPEIDVSRPVSTWAASNAGRRHMELNFDQAVLELARRTYAAIPEVPVHGIDIIRDDGTGKLYVLEVNPTGVTWHISSDFGLAQQKAQNLDYRAQFGALDIVADALIDATRREAE